MNSNMGREVFALTLITPINCTSPRFPCLLPCPNSLVTQMSAAGRREGLCLPSISSPWAAKRREVCCGLPKSVGRSPRLAFMFNCHRSYSICTNVLWPCYSGAL